ncbi:hypothetical protein [Polaribacter sp. HaHaR_3_91]|uniref:hypothetical protein n=1 Tax=Polaribacter sp. HaHaR_3_91 TaxID=2745561 RepID=UPI001C4F7CAB|nr:hypothetical protein [Polaribacter sp. HaHaR_3_91]QXP63058.1 hypothetical protein H0I27_14545 [Polaribacter sp. HaHaR_3_91]
MIIFMLPALGYSQAVPMPAGPPPPPGLPIDNLIGILFLISLGIIYGSRKILKDSSS